MMNLWSKAMLRTIFGKIHRLLMGNTPETEASLEQVIVFGSEAESFLRSDLGQYLLDRSQDEINTALLALQDVEPRAYEEIRSLQNVIRRNQDVERWIGEVIQAGIDARNLLAGEE
jgi:hypothetical protein